MEKGTEEVDRKGPFRYNRDQMEKEGGNAMENQIRFGWGSADISTEAPLNLPGQFHMRISKGILDPLTVTALAVENNG